VGHAGSKIVPVRLLPARTPEENIKVYDRKTKPLSEVAGYGRLTATGAADDNDAPQMTLPLARPRGNPLIILDNALYQIVEFERRARKIKASLAGRFGSYDSLAC
jgi:hypothetical protein